MLLENLSLFLQIVRHGSMAAAGREAGMSPATVSERLAALERHYGSRLLTRTTRALSLTEEGRALAEGAPRLLAEAEELETRLRDGVTGRAMPERTRRRPCTRRFLPTTPALSRVVSTTAMWPACLERGPCPPPR